MTAVIPIPHTQTSFPTSSLQHLEIERLPQVTHADIYHTVIQ